MYTTLQWSAVTRKHAWMLAHDQKYYHKFAKKPWHCPDEHYSSTVIPLLDPNGLEERTLTYVVSVQSSPS